MNHVRLAFGILCLFLTKSISAEPRLIISDSPLRVFVSWYATNNVGAYQLQTAPSLRGALTEWTNVGNFRVTPGTNTLAFEKSSRERFWRLQEVAPLRGTILLTNGTEVMDDVFVDCLIEPILPEARAQFAELLDIVEGKTNVLSWIDDQCIFCLEGENLSFAVDTTRMKTGVAHQLQLHLIDASGNLDYSSGVRDFYSGIVTVLPKNPISLNEFGNTGWKFYLSWSSLTSNGTWKVEVTDSLGRQFILRSGTLQGSRDAKGNIIISDGFMPLYGGYPDIDWFDVEVVVTPQNGEPQEIRARSFVEHRNRERGSFVALESGVIPITASRTNLTTTLKHVLNSVLGYSQTYSLTNDEIGGWYTNSNSWIDLQSPDDWNTLLFLFAGGNAPPVLSDLYYFGFSGPSRLGESDRESFKRITRWDIEALALQQKLTFLFLDGANARGSMPYTLVDTRERTLAEIIQGGRWPSCGFFFEGSDRFDTFVADTDAMHAGFVKTFFTAINERDAFGLSVYTYREALAIAHEKYPGVPLPSVVGCPDLYLTEHAF